METSSLQRVWAPILAGLIVAGGCAHKPPSGNRPDHDAKTGTTAGHPKPEIYANTPLTELRPPVQLQTGRYTYVPAKPKLEQLNPLLTIIDVQIPDSITTVQDSAHYLLQFSGYQLTPLNVPDPVVSALMKRPIPEVHRHFDAVILRDALLALAGNGYRLMVDPVNRSVAYARDPAYPGWVAQ
jgi:type IV pili sensor histidine kinase/response regulator